jgi:hypothetical protein
MRLNVLQENENNFAKPRASSLTREGRALPEME